jgi:hypothetical protein
LQELLKGEYVNPWRRFVTGIFLRKKERKISGDNESKFCAVKETFCGKAVY